MPNEASRLDRLIGYISPEWALRRASASHRLQAYYDGAKSTRLRKSQRTGLVGPNTIVRGSASVIRDEARALERNHDLVRGILRTMVNNIVGPNGIGIEPQPRRRDGTIHAEYAKALRDLHVNWSRRPEVTWRHSRSQMERIMCRTWIRDGEAFGQRIIGPVRGLDHGTTVPYSIEMLDPDMVPWDRDDPGNRITQGVKTNAWGRPIAYQVYKNAPDSNFRLLNSGDLKEISAAKMIHLASIDRIGQIRGVSEFASVLTRLADIKDYEESERIAAKVAASMTAFIRKGSPELFDATAYQSGEDGRPKARELTMSPGMIFDDLLPGEEVGTIDSNRPNPNIVTFRGGQLRAVAAGIGSSYSSISKDYNGTYSAQRQELVEQWVNYAVLCDEFCCNLVEPMWQDFVATADMMRILPIPRDVVPETADDAMYVAQAMPWIDPLKEAEGWLALVKAGFADEYEAIRRRGGSPEEVLERMAAFRKKAKADGLVLSSDAANDQKGAPADAPAKPAPQASVIQPIVVGGTKPPDVNVTVNSVRPKSHTITENADGTMRVEATVED